jgi:hypothetical protein
VGIEIEIRKVSPQGQNPFAQHLFLRKIELLSISHNTFDILSTNRLAYFYKTYKR